MGSDGTVRLNEPSDPGRTGADNRLFLEAVLWIARTGSPWRDLPPWFGKWNKTFKRFRDWAKAVSARNGLLTIPRAPFPSPFSDPPHTGCVPAFWRHRPAACKAVPVLFGLVLDQAGPYAALLLSSSLTGLSLVAALLLHPAGAGDEHRLEKADRAAG